MTSEESQLFSEVNKLVKRANQRLLRVERATGTRGTFASSELYDYLSASNLKAITSGGRISFKKSYNVNQLRAVKTATEKYLNESTSTVRGVKSYRKKVNEQAGKEVSFEQASAIFQARRNYKWIYEYMTASEFWTFAKTSKENGWTREQFINEISNYIESEIPDEDLRVSIGFLYDYIMEN